MAEIKPPHSGLQRRTLLGAMAGSAALPLASAAAGNSTAALVPSMKVPGGDFPTYGQPAKYESAVIRGNTPMDGYALAGSSFTPLQDLEGTITPAGLHFQRHHNGVPDIAPDSHRLVVHGMVRRPLVFTIDSLHRYPMESHVYFVECGGNSAFNAFAEPAAKSAGELHGLLSVSEWTGVRLATILDEAGVRPEASWIVAEGADGAGMARSIPLEKCLDDALLALYQNGEAIRPEQGYPLRLILPGFEGNTQIKWLHRLKLVSGPAHSREETARYAQFMKDGRTKQFDFVMGVKSVILKPSFGMTLQGPGLYEISGLAWSGAGRVKSVEVSVDGGRRWTTARLEGPATPRSANRFRLPWRWDGSPALLMSRASDETGAVQPRRSDWLKPFGPNQYYHNNSIQTWSVTPDGKIANVFA